MDKYTHGARCPKCTAPHPNVKVTYCTGGIRNSTFLCYPQLKGREHMHRRCAVCQYEWLEAPADAE